MTQWSTPPAARAGYWNTRYRPTCVSPSRAIWTKFSSAIVGRGLKAARRRYWRQTISFTLHFVVERWRDRRRGGLMRMGLSWLDFKLGFRMLSRYPMLTVVGSLAMAVAIAVGAGTFEVITRVTDPSLPLPDGDRIVGLNYWHRAESGARPPLIRRPHLAGRTSNPRGHRRVPVGPAEPDRGRASGRTRRRRRD